jgi:hypothetical protein
LSSISSPDQVEDHFTVSDRRLGEAYQDGDTEWQVIPHDPAVDRRVFDLYDAMGLGLVSAA